MLTTAPLGTYDLVRHVLGGAALLARVAVSEAQHVAVLDRIRGVAAAPSFSELFDVEQASAALGPVFGE
jgi:hypothetical protein